MSIEDIRVVAILETDKIVINKGSKDGIFEGMEFLVYNEGSEILDPITKENLGALENPKGRFKIIHIQERITTLLSKTKRPNKVASVLFMYSDIDAERDLLTSIRIGDKVKITNEL
ncbi:MAG: hypothetical protein JNL13_00725 [Chitinophagaceae bacterium]|nr:hypothetical protein [Chitinophagaceae bacterium]